MLMSILFINSGRFNGRVWLLYSVLWIDTGVIIGEVWSLASTDEVF